MKGLKNWLDHNSSYWVGKGWQNGGSGYIGRNLDLSWVVLRLKYLWNPHVQFSSCSHLYKYGDPRKDLRWNFKLGVISTWTALTAIGMVRIMEEESVKRKNKRTTLKPWAFQHREVRERRWSSKAPWEGVVRGRRKTWSMLCHHEAKRRTCWWKLKSSSVFSAAETSNKRQMGNYLLFKALLQRGP